MYELLYQSDVLSTIVLAFVLVKIGGRMVEGQVRLIRWGARGAVATFLVFGAIASLRLAPTTTGEILGIVCHSLMAASLVLGASWIGLPVLFFVWGHTLGLLFRLAFRGFRARRQRRIDRELQRLQEQQRQRAAEEWQRLAPERERQRQLESERARAAALAQLRREQARLACEVFFAKHAPEIQERFTPVDFKRFVKRYLSDDMHPDEVESRRDQLQAIIQHHADKSQPPGKFSSVADISAWYDQQASQAETIADERLRRTVLAQLKVRYADLTSHLVEEQAR